ncbi:MAG: Tn3 family transposase [Solirubrobacteraceae bacterium]
MRSKSKRVLLLIGGLVVLGIVASVAMASGGTRSGAPLRANTKVLGYKHTPEPSAARVRPGPARRARIKVLGYKHTPEQAAAARASQARSCMRQAARIRVDAALVERFHLLRDARTASASTETTIAAAISGLGPLGSTFGANPSEAGETTIGPAKDDVWVVPGSAGACLVDVDGPHGTAAGGCNSTSEVDAGDMWTLDTVPYGAGGAMTKVLLGAVPDGNASVTVSWAGGGAIFYGNEGRIRLHSLDRQSTQAAALALVATAIVTWNTRQLNTIVDRYRQAGRHLDELQLGRLSPTISEHILINGRYLIDPDRSRDRSHPNATAAMPTYH